MNCRVSQLNFAITYLCNSRCSHCHIWKHYRTSHHEYGQEISLPEIGKLLKSRCLESLEVCNITGGEPWLRSDFVNLCILFVSKFPDIILNIPTNAIAGSLVLNKLDSVFQRCNPKLLRISISLDGVAAIHDRLRGVVGNYDQAIQLIDNIKSLFPQVRLACSFTILPNNWQYVTEVYELAKRLKLRFGCQFAQVNQMRYENKTLEFSWTDDQLDSVERCLLPIAAELRSLQGYQLDAYYIERMVEYARKPSRLIDCYAGCTSGYLDPYGNVYPCINSSKQLGNIRNDSFDVIWTSRFAKSVRYDIRYGNCHCWTPCETNYSLSHSILPLQDAIVAKDKQISDLHGQCSYLVKENQALLKENQALSRSKSLRAARYIGHLAERLPLRI